MTKSQLLSATTSRELSEWQAYFQVLKEEQDEEQDVSQKMKESEARARKG